MTTIIIISIALFIIIVVLPSVAKRMDKSEREKEKIEHIKKAWGEALKEAAHETELMNSGKVPTDEDIQLYYKMYLKKKEMDAMQQWTTEEPMPFEEWEKKAKDVNDSDFNYGGYKFMVRATCDYFMGGFGGSSSGRIHDYKKMVLADEAKEKE